MQFDIDAKLHVLTEGLSELKCDSQRKQEICDVIASEINKYFPNLDAESNPSKLQELKSNGIVRLDVKLTEAQLLDVISYLSAIPVFGGHVPAQSDGIRRFLNAGAKALPFGSYALEDLVQCPHLLELALTPEILSLATAYLGCVPTIYSVNSWWSFPATAPTMTQDYHRDVDDFKFLALFVYLTDVKGGDFGGQHQFIVKTHDEDQVVQLFGGDKEKASSLFMPKLRKLGYRQSHVYKGLFATQITDITGAAGSVFLADTYALHRGVPPQGAERLVCWIRYGLKKNVAYSNDKTTPVPFKLIEDRVSSNSHANYMLRLLATDIYEICDDPRYKVLTETGLCEAKLDDLSWKNATFAPLDPSLANDDPATNKRGIKHTLKTIKKKLFRRNRL
jgi:hypothetical protein